MSLVLDHPIHVTPSSRSFDLLLTATTAISHHDAAVQDDSNRMLFNRQKQLLHRPSIALAVSQDLRDALSDEHHVPIDLLPFFADVSLPEFVGTALLRLFLDISNVGEGFGLFSGMERYSRLEPRIRQCAVGAANLRSWWTRLGEAMAVPISGGEHDRALLRLLTVPAPLGQAVLRVLAENYRDLLMLAREWHGQNKLTSAEYAAKAGKDRVTEMAWLPLPDYVTQGAEAAIVEVPTISGNSLRHQLVREPAWARLRAALGMSESVPGQGMVPAGVEAIFYNGGNIASGAKQPTDPFRLAQAIRATYPSLDLLGGVTDSFDLGESRLRVASWLVCAENREAFAGTLVADLPSAAISAFDLLDDVTLTRQAGQVGQGQMIFSLQALCPGTQVLVRLDLAPFASRLTRGALFDAILGYLSEDATLGGQAARGLGRVNGAWLTALSAEDEDAAREYAEYLDVHRERLLSGLIDGSLGSGQRVLS